MFRKNKRHLQAPLMSDLDLLSRKSRTRLEKSWAGVFRSEFFQRLDEGPFAVLYSDEPSRPNTPINVLLGLEMLKSGFGWSDEELQDHFLFDVQVRYALGYENLGAGEFDVRTLYNFRQRVSEHRRKTGENLIERAFEQVTDEQVQALRIQTGQLRMDSTQIASNIRRMSRLQLLVEVLQRVERMLCAADRARYAAALAPYLQGSSGQFLYRLKGQDTGPYLHQIGALMHTLRNELAANYAQTETYQILERVFHEQFIVQDSQPQAKADDEAGGPPDAPGASGSEAISPVPGSSEAGSLSADQEAPQTQSLIVRPGKEISPQSLRSPDDPEATYRKKGSQAYEGYVTNLTETCDPQNALQLVLKVQTAANSQEDADFLLDALPNLLARTDCQRLYHDAAFCSPAVDQALSTTPMVQIPSDLQGRAPDPQRTSLADLAIQLDEQGRLTQLTCPHGHTFPVKAGRKAGRYVTQVKADACAECQFTRTALQFSQVELDRALRRQRSQAFRQAKRNLRAAVEAAVGAVKRPFNDDQLPVRGLFRVAGMMVGAAAMLNIRRIQRYRVAKSNAGKREGAGQPAEQSAESSGSDAVVSFLSALWAAFRRWSSPVRTSASALAFDF